MDQLISYVFLLILSEKIMEENKQEKGMLQEYPQDCQITFEMMTKLPRIFVNGLNLVPNSTEVHNPLDETRGY
jgi:hypothetical protein